MGAVWNTVKDGLHQQKVKNKELWFGGINYFAIRRHYRYFLQKVKLNLNYLLTDFNMKYYLWEKDGKKERVNIEKEIDELNFFDSNYIQATIIPPTSRTLHGFRLLHEYQELSLNLLKKQCNDNIYKDVIFLNEYEYLEQTKHLIKYFK